MTNQCKRALWIFFFAAVATLPCPVLGAQRIDANTPGYELRVRFGGLLGAQQNPQLKIPLQPESPFFAHTEEAVTTRLFHRETRVNTLYVASGVLGAPRSGKFRLESQFSRWVSAEDNSAYSSAVELELNKPRAFLRSGGLAHGFTVVLLKLPAGARLAAELPAGARIQYETPLWGDAIDGIQLGARPLNSQRAFQHGEVAHFTLLARNNSKRTVRLKHSKPDWSLQPSVTHESGDPLSIVQQAGLIGPAYNIPVYLVETLIGPGETAEVAKASLTVGAARENESNPNLDAASGRFKVSYSYRFMPGPEQVKPDAPPVWSGVLASGQVLIEVVAPRN